MHVRMLAAQGLPGILGFNGQSYKIECISTISTTTSVEMQARLHSPVRCTLHKPALGLEVRQSPVCPASLSALWSPLGSGPRLSPTKRAPLT